MRTPFALVLLAMALAGTGAFAQRDSGQDVVGMYFDQGATNWCEANPTPNAMLDIYFIVTNLSEPSGMAGYECGIFPVPASVPGGWSFSPSCDFYFLPYIQCGFAQAMPRTPEMILGVLATYYLGGTIQFYLGPYQPTSFPENPGPGYAAGADPGHEIRFNYPDYARPDPQHSDRWLVAQCGGCSFVPTQPSTWSAVKGLYQ